IKLDEMAKDEEKNRLNIYDFFFEPTHEIIYEDIKSTLDFYYSTHPQELFRECSHYCELVSSPEQIPQVLAIAMRKAVLNRGVSV
ncbi:DUF4765 family protein, partial [Salmonella enterica subsp. enterica serovar Kentucky]|nr:DUF4765 family protein [Salmonella enterica subsp. enterica serovar Kentucky]